MLNVASIRPKYGDPWMGDMDTQYYFVSIKPLTETEFAVYEKNGYLVLSIMETVDEYTKYLDILRIPYEKCGRWNVTVRVKIDHFDKAEP